MRIHSDNLNLWLLITGSVFIIPLTFSCSTIDPVLPLRFLCWAVLTGVLIFSLLVADLRGFKNLGGLVPGYDLGILNHGVFRILICLLLFSIISLLNAVNLAEGLWQWLKTCLFVIFFYAASVVIANHKEGMLCLTRSVVILGILLGGMGVCQYYDLAFTRIPGHFNVYATLANKNLFASGVFLCLPFVLFGAFQFSGRWRNAGVLSLSLILFNMVITQTRAVWLAMLLSGAGVLIIKAFLMRGRSGQTFFQGKITITVFIIIILSVVSAAALSEIKPQSLMSIESLKERTLLWQKTVEMIQAGPLWGVGPGQWKIWLPHYGKIQKTFESEGGSVEVCFQRPHNDYLWVLSETGVPGLVCYLSFFLILIGYCLKIILKSETDEAKSLAFFMLFGLQGYMIVSFFCFPNERIFHNIFLILMAVCVSVTYHHKFPISSKTGPLTHSLLNALFLLLTLFCMVFGFQRYQSDVHAKSGLMARKIGNWDQVISEMNQAESWFYNMDPASTPLAWYRGMAHFTLNRTAWAAEDFKTACEVHPYHVHALNNAGACQAILGDYARAMEYYRRALAVFPGFNITICNIKKIPGTEPYPCFN
jgi:O-antigen ligase